MDPSTDFGNMMQTAMKIKGHQMEQDRRKFETHPQFFQNSMWMKGEALALRELPVAERLPGATSLKEAGNELFKQRHFSAAAEQYEQALGSFKWLKQLDDDWKKKGIRDETIEVVADFGDEGGEARASVVALMVSCYNNLAACYLGRARAGSKEPGLTVDGDYALCTEACGCALELQPGHAKALYRRACARTEPIAAGATEVDEAIKDLAEAARHAPDDKAVRAMLGKLRGQRRSAKEKDTATFSGLFGRGEIYDEQSLQESEKRQRAEAERARKKEERTRTPDDCEREAKEAEAVVAHLRAQGKHDDASQLEGKIADHRKQLEVFKTTRGGGGGGGGAGASSGGGGGGGRGKRDPRDIDFRNPTEEQLRDAETHGIDLRDPMVVAELVRLQREKLGEEEEDDEDDDDDDDYDDDDARAGGGRGEARREQGESGRGGARRRRPPPPDVHGMPLWEIKRRLDEMSVEYNDIDADRPALERRLMEQYGSSGSHNRRRRRDDDGFDDDGLDAYGDGDGGAGGWLGGLFSWCSLL